MIQGQLLLWGEVAVGKSTLLATGLLARTDRMPAYDATSMRQKGSEGAWNLLQETWRDLQENRPTRQTDRPIDLALILSNGNAVTIRDIQGAMTRRPDEEESFRQRGIARGVLFVCEWQGDDIARHMRALRAALPFCQERKTGLALTKCERGLDALDPHWQAPPGWWAEHPCWDPYADVLNQFGDRVWPTSAFGFDAEGRSATLLDEFGRLLPFRVQPRNVEAPFLWFFEALGIWTPGSASS